MKKKIIGITGGIGCGKSKIVRYITKNYRVSAILADEVGHALMKKGHSVYEALRQHYGERILNADGEINRVILSQIAFSSHKELSRLNRMEHPLIKKEIEKKIKNARFPIVFIEAALLEEGDLASVCDFILYIHVHPEIRMKRLGKSRGLSKERFQAICGEQMKEKEYRKLADFTVENSGDFNDTKKEIDLILKTLKAEKRKNAV